MISNKDLFSNTRATKNALKLIPKYSKKYKFYKNGLIDYFALFVLAYGIQKLKQRSLANTRILRLLYERKLLINALQKIE